MSSNTKYGIVPVRMLSQKQIGKLKDMLALYQGLLDQNRTECIHWVSIYNEKKFLIENSQIQPQFHDWIHNLVSEIESGVPHIVHSYGFLQSPIGHRKNQNFHYDYDPSCTTIFIPFTYYVYENSPQFLTFMPSCPPTIDPQSGEPRFGGSQKQLLEREGVDCLTICHIASKPFVVAKMLPGTIHRGMSNRSDQDRLVFFMNYAPKVIDNGLYTQSIYAPKVMKTQEGKQMQNSKE